MSFYTAVEETKETFLFHNAEMKIEESMYLGEIGQAVSLLKINLILINISLVKLNYKFKKVCESMKSFSIVSYVSS